MLPQELVYEIVATCVLCHLDDLIAGPLALPFLDTRNDEGLIQDGPEFLRTRLTQILMDDRALAATNPVISLLRASFQLRDTTLEILASALGISTVAGDVKRYDTRAQTVLMC